MALREERWRSFCFTWSFRMVGPPNRSITASADSLNKSRWTAYHYSPIFRTAFGNFSFSWQAGIGSVRGSDSEPNSLILALFRVSNLSIPVIAKWRCTLTAAAVVGGEGTRKGEQAAVEFSWGNAEAETFQFDGGYEYSKEVDAFLNKAEPGREATVLVTMLIDSEQFDVLKRFATEAYPLVETVVPGPVLNNLKQLCGSEEYSDFKLLSSDGETINIHKAILAGASGYFRTLFAERNSQMIENENVSASLPYRKAAIVTVMRYIYTAELNFPADLTVEDYEQILEMVEMYNVHDAKKRTKNTIEFRLTSQLCEQYNRLMAVDCARMARIHEMPLLYDLTLTQLIRDCTIEKMLHEIVKNRNRAQTTGRTVSMDQADASDMDEEELEAIRQRLDVIVEGKTLRQCLLQATLELARCQDGRSALYHGRDLISLLA